MHCVHNFFNTTLLGIQSTSLVIIIIIINNNNKFFYSAVILRVHCTLQVTQTKNKSKIQSITYQRPVKQDKKDAF
mgnify:CR=1 FL=1